AELQLFVQQFLLAPNHTPRYTAFLGDTGSAQKVRLLVKTELSAVPVPAAQLAGLIGRWQADVDGDSVIDTTLYHFTRNPLVVDVAISGTVVRFIVLHTKSNFIQNGQALWSNPATRQQYVSQALVDRRRISTEAMRVRAYLD